MGDVDILVSESQKQKAGDMLIKIGFSPENITDCEWCYKKENLEIELHHTLVYDRLVTSKKHKVFFDTVWEHTYLKTGMQHSMEIEYHLAYLIVHLRKHILNCGAGIRQFMDLAALSLYGNIDWNKVRCYLEQLDLQVFAANCFALCEHWFNVKFGISTDVSEHFYDIATQNIFSNGIFGYDNELNKNNELYNKLRNRKNIGSLLLKTLFPSYRDTCSCSYCSFIIGKPWLLPIAWLYRCKTNY